MAKKIFYRLMQGILIFLMLWFVSFIFALISLGEFYDAILVSLVLIIILFLICGVVYFGYLGVCFLQNKLEEKEK